MTLTERLATNGGNPIAIAVPVGKNGEKYCWPRPAKTGYYLP
jgi:hypothetical protein